MTTKFNVGDDDCGQVTHSIYCPKCGRLLFREISIEDPKYCLVVLHLRCPDCGTFDVLGGKEE